MHFRLQIILIALTVGCGCGQESQRLPSVRRDGSVSESSSKKFQRDNEEYGRFIAKRNPMPLQPSVKDNEDMVTSKTGNDRKKIKKRATRNRRMEGGRSLHRRKRDSTSPDISLTITKFPTSQHQSLRMPMPKSPQTLKTSKSTYRRRGLLDDSYQGKGTSNGKSMISHPSADSELRSYRDVIVSKTSAYRASKGKGKGINNSHESTLFENCAKICQEQSSSSDYVSYGVLSKGKGGAKGSSRIVKGKGKGKGRGISSKMATSGSSGKGKGKGKGKGTGKGAMVSHSGSSTDSMEQKNECCSSGVSFLKFRVEGLESNGTLSIGTKHSCDGRDMKKSPSQVATTGGKGGKGSKIGLSPLVRFLPCNDPCLESFGNGCSVPKANIIVDNGSDVCIARWNPVIDMFEFQKKLPLTVQIIFTSDMTATDTAGDYFATFHTSCSKPIYPPFAVEMTDSCSGSMFSPFIVEDTSFTTPTITFTDGFSPTLNREAMMFGMEIPFDHKFASCSCNCEDEDDVTKLPTSSPSTKPLPMRPTSEPSKVVVPSLSPSDSAETCNDQCEEWVASNCYIPGDELSPERPCVEDNRDAGRFLDETPSMNDIVEDEINNEIADLLERLLVAGLFD